MIVARGFVNGNTDLLFLKKKNKFQISIFVFLFLKQKKNMLTKHHQVVLERKQHILIELILFNEKRILKFVFHIFFLKKKANVLKE